MTSSLTDEQGLFRMDFDLMATTMWDVLGLTGIENLPAPETMVDITLLEDAFANCGASLLEC